jgi:hypothetical protein
MADTAATERVKADPVVMATADSSLRPWPAKKGQEIIISCLPKESRRKGETVP